MTIEEYGNDMYETGLGDGIAKGKAEERKKAVRILAAAYMEVGNSEEQAVSKVALVYPELSPEEIKAILSE